MTAQVLPIRKEVDSRPALLRRALAFLDATPDLPRPGAGDTLGRWRALAALGAEDLCLAKLLEAHYDALAILAELDSPAPPQRALWAVWAAEPPSAQVAFTPALPSSSDGYLAGTKAWCSGSHWVDHALMTVREGENRLLVAVDMTSEGIEHDQSAWQAVGMADIVSGTVRLHSVPARTVGASGAYLQRPGFWHGGAGIAAVWWGATARAADTLRVSARSGADAHALANLGHIDMAISAAAALLRETATRIDRAPHLDHRHEVMRVRSVVERMATDVMDRVGRATGAGPLCLDRRHAVRMADLAVFIRQSHAERDWEAIGQMVVHPEYEPWTL